jgi:glutamine amidotransferase
LKFLILDYGVGNHFSINNALDRLGVVSEISSEIPKKSIDAIILPGVGSFSSAQEILAKNRGKIKAEVKAGTPLLGICLGMQLLFTKSEEGKGLGLSFFQDPVVRFGNHVKTPHIGWNTLEEISSHSVLADGVSDGEWVYYVHSYFPKTNGVHVMATTTYGERFPAIVEKENVFGTQFHPEKSQKTGLKILQNFVEYCKR